MNCAISAIRIPTFVWASRKRITSGSRPVRLRRLGSQYGFGSERASNTKSASPGMPCLNPNDSKVIDSRLPDPFVDALPQRVFAHLGCVDHQVSRVDNGFEQLPLQRHGFAQVDVVAA